MRERGKTTIHAMFPPNQSNVFELEKNNKILRKTPGDRKKSEE